MLLHFAHTTQQSNLIFKSKFPKCLGKNSYIVCEWKMWDNQDVLSWFFVHYRHRFILNLSCYWHIFPKGLPKCFVSNGKILIVANGYQSSCHKSSFDCLHWWKQIICSFILFYIWCFYISCLSYDVSVSTMSRDVREHDINYRGTSDNISIICI